MKFDFPEGIRDILKILVEDNGFEAYVVGGAIRDMLMGMRPNDYDITTNASPEDVVSIFTPLHSYMVADIDAASFKVVTVNGVEIATYRKDIHTNNTVETVVVKTLEEDLKRRDFTVNAMAAGLNGELIDIVGGQKDLENRVVRYVGVPKRRIIEDPVRMIRGARVAAKIDGHLDNEAFVESLYYGYLIGDIASERIRLEVIKTMKHCEKASKFFRILKTTHNLHRIFPSLYKTFSVDGGKQHRETVFQHSMLTGDYMWKTQKARCRENPMLRLAGYLHDIGKSDPNYKDGEIHFYHHELKSAELVKQEMMDLKFTKKEIDFVHGLILIHMNGGVKMSPKSTRKLLVKLKAHGLDHKDWITMREADRAANLAKGPYEARKLQKLHDKFNHELDPSTDNGACPTDMKDLAISGTIVQKLLGIGPSQIVGVILQYLFDRTVMDPTLNTPEELVKMVVGKRMPKKEDVGIDIGCGMPCVSSDSNSQKERLCLDEDDEVDKELQAAEEQWLSRQLLVNRTFED